MAIFRFPPSELRAKRRRGEHPSLDGGLTLLIPYVQPYDHRRVLRHLAARCVPGVEEVEGDTYRRSIDSCGHPGVAEVTDAHDGEHLLLTLHLPTFDSIIDEVERCRNLFAVDEEPDGLALLWSDPVLGAAATSHPGLRVPRCWDRFETAIRVVVGQQISVAGATTMIGRIVQRYGQRFDSGVTGISHQFPAARVLAEASLEGLGFTSRRIETIAGLSAAVASGEVDLHSTGSIETITRDLSEVKGIGPWTAHMIAMRVMGHHDAMPASDLGLRRGLEALTGTPVSTAQLEDAATAWRPVRSWAAQLLWTAADPAANITIDEEAPHG